MEAAIQKVGHHSPSDEHINLKWPERYISIMAGFKVGLSGFKNLFKNPVSSIIKIGTGGYLLNRGITGHCELYNMVGKSSTQPVTVAISTSVTINKNRQDVYDFWRKLDNLPLFMSHLNSVELLPENQSKWTLKVPTGIAEVSWIAEITQDIPGEVIAWESINNQIIDTQGQVRFIDTPEPDTTLMHIIINYTPPAGGIGAGIAHLINPMLQQMVEDDIQNFKRYMDISTILIL